VAPTEPCRRGLRRRRRARRRRSDALATTERHIARTRAKTPAGVFAKLAILEHHVFAVMNAENPDCTELLALSLIGDVRRVLG
jgi:hypothetical protein